MRPAAANDARDGQLFSSAPQLASPMGHISRSFVIATRVSSASAFAKMGLSFGERLDGVFREAKLPNGWRIRATPSALCSELIDARGQTRAGIFYRSGHKRTAALTPLRRYTVEIEYQGRFGEVGESHRSFVIDHVTQQELFSTKTLRREEKTDRTFLKTEVIKGEAAQWLTARFPDHQDPAAYWDV